MMNLICPMDLILFLIFKIVLNISLKKHETMRDTENPPVENDMNEMKNRIVFKLKTDYKLELLTEETIQLLGSSKKVIDKNENGELVQN